jgi:hypothetical protein
MGESWSFNSHLYGSKGTTTSVTTGCSIDANDGKYGGGCLAVATGNIFNIASAYTVGTGVTVLVWRKETVTNDATGYTHFICTEDSALSNYYSTNGAAKAGGLPSGVAIANGAVTIQSYAGAARYFDDLVILPFVIPDAWMAAMYAHLAVYAMSALPALTLTGTLLWETNATRTVLGQSDSGSVIKAVVGGTYTNLARQLSVSLQQT